MTQIIISQNVLDESPAILCCHTILRGDLDDLLVDMRSFLKEKVLHWSYTLRNLSSVLTLYLPRSSRHWVL